MGVFSTNQQAQQSLVRMLIRLGLLKADQVDRYGTQQDWLPIAYFARQGLLDEDEAIQALAQSLNLPVFSLTTASFHQVTALLESPDIPAVSNEEWSAMRAIPILKDAGTLTVAAANPLDQQNLKALEFRVNMRVQGAIGREDDIISVLSRKAPDFASEFRTLLQEQRAPTPATSNSADFSRGESNVSSQDISAAPIIRLVNRILAEGVQAKASDIHISPERDHLEIRLRVDGILRSLFTVPATLQAPVVSRIKLVSGMDISERRKPQDGRVRIKTPLGAKDLRISTIPTIHGENVVIRIQSSDLSQVSLDALGFTEHEQALLRRNLAGSSKVVLVTGPTGSGKTSTLYASLMERKDGATNIVTIEDPIEYRIPGINQTQVHTKIGVTFASGLRSILRQDPDVIMVGEIRDADTAQIALQAAQTGHLVLSTLHTNSAVATITRLKDLGIPNYLISSAIGAVVAQRLLRKLCSACAVPDQNPLLSNFEVLGVKPENVLKAGGCEACSNTGFSGRTVLVSMMEITEAVKTAIREEKSEPEIENLARQSGFVTLLESGIAAVNSGLTSVAELERCLGSLELTLVTALSAKSNSSNGTAGNSRPRMLLVDDDEDLRSVLSLVFSREFFDVEEAVDGIDALEKVYRQIPDVVVCDLMMPRLDGLGFVKKLRRDSRFKCIPVLMLTAAVSEENEIQLIDSGADDFVSKSSDSKVMISRINRLLERAN